MHGGEQQRVLVVGAGGHAKVCVDVLGAMAVDVVGAVSRDGSGIDGLGVPVLGADGDIDEIAASVGATSYCVAIGDNEHRRRWSERLRDGGASLATVIAPSAVVSPAVDLGAGVQVMPAAVINAGTVIADGVIVNTNATVDHDNDIGAFTHVAPGVALAGGVRVGRGVLVGIGARVLPGVSIGDGATVGAGAVVVADVADGETVVGVPARPVRGAR